MPRLTQAAYDQAARLWDEHGPASYDLDLELEGNRPGKIHVEVRDGQVVHMTRDGVEPKQERTWFYWSVPGQLDTIAEELEMARDPAQSFDSPKATQVVIWGEFDPYYGYPKRYDRVVLGTNFEIHWKTISFRDLSGGRDARKVAPGCWWAPWAGVKLDPLTPWYRPEAACEVFRPGGVRAAPGSRVETHSLHHHRPTRSSRRSS